MSPRCIKTGSTLDVSCDWFRNLTGFCSLYAPCARPLPYSVPELAFSYCSRMLSQFGYAGMAKRQHFHLMNRTDEMFRDLNLLDKRPKWVRPQDSILLRKHWMRFSRDFQKIAVIYIARGQEDKMSIMTNSAGSAAYERFVNRLGWTVSVWRTNCANFWVVQCVLIERFWWRGSSGADLEMVPTDNTVVKRHRLFTESFSIFSQGCVSIACGTWD